ncbi:MAG TPA: ROK family transcriptional regulator [Actinocrinis sp.]|jgi:predicted NBD/HSP70 family sugar kinase|uniref:ROK family transcriptional regulator n=1 Tax=Actinocrinis sp. TaxID=1920516 RepID=UPI002DDD8B06|nr:ROK family transcriptional regulator [Actinocrinis sp.]HEV3171312.1 ROK family transcriptional regulator [Actinocrinis sp.]
MAKRTARDIRRNHRQEVLRQVIAASPVSRRELARATGLSVATVANLVGELQERGMLAEVGFEDSAGGRPRGLLAVKADGGALIGVDVAEAYVHAELFDLELTVKARNERKLAPGETRPQDIAQHVAAGVRAVLREARIASSRVLGVGVSVPGQVERVSGRSVSAPNWGWRDVPLRDLLLEQLDFPLYLDNPLKAYAVAELWFGAARGCDDAVMVVLGTGVGAGIAVGGALYRGATNGAGEWGHTTLVIDGRPCHCGARGCLEAYVGAPGIVQTMREIEPDSPMILADQASSLDALARGLAVGDAVAAETLRRTAHHLGAGVGNLINLLNPQIVVLGGWAAASLGPALLDAVRDGAREHALAHLLAGTEIVPSPIVSNPVSLGAATLALEGALDHPAAAAAPGSPARPSPPNEPSEPRPHGRRILATTSSNSLTK